MSEGVSKRTLFVVVAILVVIMLGQAGWLLLYQARMGELEALYRDLQKQNTNLANQIKELQPRIADESIVGLLAYRHWSAICNRDLNGVMSQYATDAKLYWLGCPLMRNCTDSACIRDQWSRFFDFTVGQPLCICVQSYSVRLIPGFHAGFMGGIVNARVSFCCPNSTAAGAAAPPIVDCRCPTVNYALVYMLRDGKWVLVDEWWVLPPRWHPYITY